MIKRWPRILMYHSVGELGDDPNLLSISPARFESQLLYLKRHNLRGVSMRELFRAISTGEDKGLIGLTFDDGYEDFLYTAVPILERLGYSATVFMVAGMPGGENDWEHAFTPRPRLRLLDAEGIRETSELGMEVGSHTMTHARLPGAKAELLEHEVGESRRVLSEVLGKSVEGFCYPYGSLDSAAVQAARRAGYAYACGWNTLVDRSAYDLPRIPISERDDLRRFAAKLRIYPQYVTAKRALSRLRGGTY
jgi:peptidoglycan/xylan/chitin deacetylase (PgdA/CDA1 family)